MLGQVVVSSKRCELSISRVPFLELNPNHKISGSGLEANIRRQVGPLSEARQGQGRIGPRLSGDQQPRHVRLGV